MDYSDLQLFAKEIVKETAKLNILSRLYWYSPKSRKLQPASKIGYYETNPQGIRFAHGCKLIMVFPRLAFDRLKPIINKYSTQSAQIAYRDDYRCKDDIGFDVYQRVQELKLFIEPNVYSSEKFTVEGMLKKGEYWADCQRKALNEVEPPLSEQQISKAMKDVTASFKQALGYLKDYNDSQAKICVRRLSGVRHRMVRVDLAGDQSEKVGFSNFVLVFGTSSKLPYVLLPKEPNSTRKPRTDSKAAQYKANPSSFKYYDKFGIFEVYDK
jgi:hypothetical protein